MMNSLSWSAILCSASCACSDSCNQCWKVPRHRFSNCRHVVRLPESEEFMSHRNPTTTFGGNSNPHSAGHRYRSNHPLGHNFTTSFEFVESGRKYRRREPEFWKV